MKFLLLLSLSAFAAPSPATLWREFAASPATHSRIPDNSYAGYGYGEAPLPPPAKAPLNAREKGVKGDGLTDDTAALQSLLDAGGEIYLPAGTYRIRGRLRLSRSGTALSGAGKNKTKLIFESPLSAVEPESVKFKYSWNGGLLHVGPAEDFKGALIPNEEDRSGWRLGAYLGTVRGAVSRGERRLGVENAGKFRVGQWIFVSWPPHPNLLADVAGFPRGNNFDWAKAGKMWVDKTLRWPVQVAEVGQDSITLRQPLRLPIEKDWTVKLHALERFVEGVSLRGFSLDFKSGEPSPHNQELGFNGIFFHRALHSFAADISIANADSAVLLDGTKNITLARIEIRGTRAYHHGFFGKNNHDTLVTDFVIDAPIYHGINADVFGSGNVWRRGRMKRGTFDMHRGMQFDLIRTDITLHNEGVSGGVETNGPMQGTRAVHWNIAYTGPAKNVAEPALHPSGALVGLRGKDAPAPGERENGCVVSGSGNTPVPADLYQAQVELRVKKKKALR